MRFDIGRIPHGVQLPRTLTESDAREVVRVLADAYKWTHVIISADDIGVMLDPRAEYDLTRGLTAEEWSRLRSVATMRALPSLLRRAITHSGLLRLLAQEAAIQCRTCGNRLTGPPASTWGHCPSCLLTLGLPKLQRLPCPVTGLAHEWSDGSCTACTMPAPRPQHGHPGRALPRAA